MAWYNEMTQYFCLGIFARMNSPGAVLIALVCALCGLLLAVVALVPRRTRVTSSTPLQWYLDEACQTGDLIFFESKADATRSMVSSMTHVGILVLHPTSGEPLLVEFLEGGTVVNGQVQNAGLSIWPARTRLYTTPDILYVCGIKKPVSPEQTLCSSKRLGRIFRFPDRLAVHVARCKLLCWMPLPGMCPAHDEAMCSEFAAKVMCEQGVLTRWRCMTPSDLKCLTQASGMFLAPTHLSK
jgi:hypothetical protein